MAYVLHTTLLTTTRSNLSSLPHHEVIEDLHHMSLALCVRLFFYVHLTNNQIIFYNFADDEHKH